MLAGGSCLHPTVSASKNPRDKEQGFLRYIRKTVDKAQCYRRIGHLTDGLDGRIVYAIILSKPE